LITESFLNSCFSLVLNQKVKLKRTKILYRDILEQIEFVSTKETFDIPLAIQSKVDCLQKILQMLLEDKTIENVLDSISFSEKFKPFQDFLQLKSDENLKPNVFDDTIRQLRLRKKVSALFKNYDELSRVLDTIKDGSFDSIDDLVIDYEVTIKKLYSNMMESNRAVTIEEAASLDLLKDDYNHAIDMIKQKYDRTNKTPTGFPLLDGDIYMGGFDPSRLYIVGGGSGAGKSTMLNNFIMKSACLPPTLNPEYQKKKKVFIYITLENTIEESFLRSYCILTDKTLNQALKEISATKDSSIIVKKKVCEELERNNSTIVMKYFPAMSISCIDIMGVVDDVIDEYGKETIQGLYIDYLDLLKTDTKYDLYRMELGYITLSLKTIAVEYNMPVITATQLGRAAYKIEHSNELNLDQIGESIKKVEHADSVLLLAKDRSSDNIVHGKVGKNRAGRSNVAVDFAVDFSKSKFLSASFSSNESKKDAGSESQSPVSFKGIVSSI
jgi:replicative DNA helicase